MESNSQPVLRTRTNDWTRKNRKSKFNERDDQLIKTMVNESQKNHEKVRWEGIARMLTNRPKGSDVSHRWKTVLNPNLVKGCWTQNEDQIIIDWVKENGATGWTQLSRNKLSHRSGKQLRERWINVLSPALSASQTQDSQNIKSYDLFNESSQMMSTESIDRDTQNSQFDQYFRRPWDADEDEIIIKMYKSFGPRWKKISECLEGRSENNVKNRWHALEKQKSRLALGLEPIQKRGRKPEKLTKKNDENNKNPKMQRNLEESTEINNDSNSNLPNLSIFDLDPENISSNVWPGKEMNENNLDGNILSPTSCYPLSQNIRIQFGSNRYLSVDSPIFIPSCDLFCDSPELLRSKISETQFPSPISHIDQLFEDKTSLI